VGDDWCEKRKVEVVCSIQKEKVMKDEAGGAFGQRTSNRGCAAQFDEL
jgi:hypothetical protein